jgi:hypothetical protein
MPTNISSATLRKLVKLSGRKDALLAQIQKIDHEIVVIQRQALSAGQMEKAPVTFSGSRGSKAARSKRRSVR